MAHRRVELRAGCPRVAPGGGSLVLLGPPPEAAVSGSPRGRGAPRVPGLRVSGSESWAAHCVSHGPRVPGCAWPSVWRDVLDRGSPWPWTLGRPCHPGTGIAMAPPAKDGCEDEGAAVSRQDPSLWGRQGPECLPHTSGVYPWECRAGEPQCPAGSPVPPPRTPQCPAGSPAPLKAPQHPAGSPAPPRAPQCLAGSPVLPQGPQCLAGSPVPSRAPQCPAGSPAPPAPPLSQNPHPQALLCCVLGPSTPATPSALLADVCEHGPASGPLHRCPAPGSSLHTPPRPLLLLPLRGCIPGPGKPLIPACFFAA